MWKAFPYHDVIMETVITICVEERYQGNVWLANKQLNLDCYLVQPHLSYVSDNFEGGTYFSIFDIWIKSMLLIVPPIRRVCYLLHIGSGQFSVWLQRHAVRNLWRHNVYTRVQSETYTIFMIQFDVDDNSYHTVCNSYTTLVFQSLGHVYETGCSCTGMCMKPTIHVRGILEVQLDNCYSETCL